MTTTKLVLLLSIATGSVTLVAATGAARPAEPVPAQPAVSLEPTRILNGSVLHQSEDLALPTELEVSGDRLVISDDFAERSIHVVRRADGSKERAFGRKGRGPREFETVFSVDAIDGHGRLMIHDPTLQRITWVDLDRDFEGDEWVADRSVRINANAMVVTAAWVPDGIVGLGSFTGGRVAHLTVEGRMVRTSGPAPVEPGTVRPQVWTRAYQADLASNPRRTRFAVASRFADRLEIYDRAGELVAMGDRPYDFDPEDLREEDPAKVRFGYIAVTATESRIYALFSGRTRGEGAAYLGDRIHVFDWNGRMVDSWDLDSRLITLAAAPDGDQLYGIRHDPLPAVVEYTLD